MAMVWTDRAPNNDGRLCGGQNVMVFNEVCVGSYRWICANLIAPFPKRSSAIRVIESAAERTRTSLSASAEERTSIDLGRKRSM